MRAIFLSQQLEPYIPSNWRQWITSTSRVYLDLEIGDDVACGREIASNAPLDTQAGHLTVVALRNYGLGDDLGAGMSDYTFKAYQNLSMQLWDPPLEGRGVTPTPC